MYPRCISEKEFNFLKTVSKDGLNMIIYLIDTIIIWLYTCAVFDVFSDNVEEIILAIKIINEKTHTCTLSQVLGKRFFNVKHYTYV